MIPLYDLLDPREQCEPAIRDSVHIPASELASRTYELPSKGHIVQVVEGFQESEGAISILRDLGRQPRLFQNWEYDTRETGRLWEQNPLLSLAGFPGRALDLGCGSGRDAVYLASLGWQVTAIDHLPDAIELAKALESRFSGYPSVNWVTGDASEVQSGSFSLITSFRFLDRDALSNALELLEIGGHVMLEALSTTHRDLTGSPRDASWSASLSEFNALFPGFTLVLAEEGEREGKHTVRFVAKKTC